MTLQFKRSVEFDVMENTLAGEMLLLPAIHSAYLRGRSFISFCLNIFVPILYIWFHPLPCLSLSLSKFVYTCSIPLFDHLTI